jgi:hypothetical protein
LRRLSPPRRKISEFSTSRAAALSKAHAAGAFGADYIANILRQQQVRRQVQPPLRFQDPLLNELATDPLSLLDYGGTLDPFVKLVRCRSSSNESFW